MVSKLLGVHCVLVLHCLSKGTGRGISGDNIALHKPARQSSTLNNRFLAVAGLAVDGGLKPEYYDGSCSHTDKVKDPQQWWEVDLEKEYVIGSVRLLNRNVAVKRLHDVSVDVYLSETDPRKKKHCSNHTGPAGRGWLNLSCDPPVTGRYVRISKPQRNVRDALTLCEVEIYQPEDKKRNFKLTEEMLTTLPSVQDQEFMDWSFLNCCSICN